MSAPSLDRKVLADLADFARARPTTIRIRRGQRRVQLLTRTTPAVRSLILAAIQPEEIYPTDRGIGVDEALVRRLLVLHGAADESDGSAGSTAASPPSTSSSPPSSSSSPPGGDPPEEPPPKRPGNLLMAAFDAAEADLMAQMEGLVDTSTVIGVPDSDEVAVDPPTWQVAEPAELAAQLADCEKSRSSSRRQVIEALSKRPSRRLPLIEQSHFPALDALGRAFPNFQSVIEEVSTQLRFRSAIGLPLELPPVLLHGPPGIGKTEFARRLAGALDLHFVMRSFAEMSASFVLTGSHRSWNGSVPGLVAKTISDLPDGRLPLILIDELDKVHRSANHPPDQALLGLLEPSTASRFHDECLDLPINARPVVWLMTCNEIRDVVPALRSRLQVIDIEAPTRDQMPAVVRSIDAAIRERTPAIAKVFRPLSKPVIEALADTNPRELYRLLQKVYALAGKNLKPWAEAMSVTGRHVGTAKATVGGRGKVTFGFVGG